jgi:hypothetical protein
MRDRQYCLTTLGWKVYGIEKHVGGRVRNKNALGLYKLKGLTPNFK